MIINALQITTNTANESTDAHDGIIFWLYAGIIG